MYREISYPMVSVMIPTYGQDKYIEKTVRSALSQDYPSLEIVISDDCSPDSTQEICEKLALEHPIVRYYRNSTNLGRVKNYHETLYNRVQGDYVVNLDGDDLFIDSTFIRKGVERLGAEEEQDKPQVYIACKRLYYMSTGKYIENTHNIPDTIKIIEGREFFMGAYNKYKFSHLTTIFKREDALKLDFYNLDVISSDSASLYKLIAHSKVILSKEVVGQWNMMNSNESLSPIFEKHLDNLKWIDTVDEYSKTLIPKRCRLAWKWKSLYYYGRSVYNTFILNENRSYSNFKKIISNKFFIYLLLFLPAFILKRK